MRAMYKSELARCAGVSERTLRRWLTGHQEKLARWHVCPRTRLLPPEAVLYISDYFCINLDAKRTERDNAP